MADLQKKSTDLSTLLPSRFRDKTIVTLLKNLFNKQLTKTESQTLFGYIGDKTNSLEGDVYITESTAERQINQLSPVIYLKKATEESIWTWQDLLQKMVVSGVDYSTISDWLQSKSFNFAPPVDLDKFCNFNEYLWIGNWILNHPSLPYENLGIPTEAVQIALNRSNPTAKPEYFVVGRGSLSSSGVPLPVIPDLSGWSDWALCNLWVHREDVINFYNNYTGVVNFSELTQATRPILEYFSTLKINTYVNSSGAPSDSGIAGGVTKTRPNQPPLFDVYYNDGTHLNVTSALFYYQESSTAPIDSVIGRRLEIDSIDEFTFAHSLQHPTTSEMLYYKLYDGTSYKLKTIWEQGDVVSTKYVKYDETGDLVTIDKITNFANYYWVGAAASASVLPSYNQNGDPEYYVIAGGSGDSDWSKYNFWVHVSALKRADLKKYIQATQPIVELNALFEPSLKKAKTTFNEIPRFTKYMFNDITNQYDVIPGSTNIYLNDAYADGVILARVSDLGPISTIINNTVEIQPQLLTINGETYIQGLLSGYNEFTVDGQPIDYMAVAPIFTGSGNGSATAFITDKTTLVPQLIQLTATSTTTFSVYSTVLGNMPELTVDVTYGGIPGLTFKVLQGTAAFAGGDAFVFALKTTVYTSAPIYAKQDTVYKTLAVATDILSSIQAETIVAADITQKNGSYEVPDQLKWNFMNETRASITQGDLYTHFTTIIAAQPDLVGSESGQNNWRLINKNYGLGGLIKQYDGRFSLLASILMQENVTMNSLIDFAQQNYDQMIAQISTYVENVLPSLISTGTVTIPTAGDDIDSVIIEGFKTYYKSNTKVALSNTTLDDYIAEMFYDTTSAIENVIVTLPYLGLAPAVAPMKAYNGDLNMSVMVHHDGHQTALITENVSLLKRIVTKSFLRSNGQQTQGIIGGLTYPSLPFQGQYWFDTTTNTLFVYDVVSDTGALPDDVPYGSFSYNRNKNTIWQYNGEAWTQIGSDSVSLAEPWTKVPFELIINNLMLAVEKELYLNCPPRNAVLNSASLQQNKDYSSFMQTAFERFGVKHNVTDVYSSSFYQDNAFTWNYTQAVFGGGVAAHTATWQDIYRQRYGTSRPDLFPWIMAGYSTEAAFLNALILAGVVPAGTTSFTTSLWPTVAPFIRAALSSESKPVQLSIDLSTGALLAPYGTTAENLTNVVPAGIANRYTFGQNGPVEQVWKISTDYLYSQVKTYFKLDPLNFVDATWGDAAVTVDGYSIDMRLGKKLAPIDIMLHGDQLPTVSSSDWVSFTYVSMPDYPLTYNVEIVSRVDGIAKITGTNFAVPTFVNITTGYIDSYIHITFNPSRVGFNWGDVYVGVIDALGSITTSYTPQSYFRSEGFNQLFIQYLRSFGDDMSISTSVAVLRNWEMKLGYRFGGLVNSDVFQVSNDDAIIASKNYEILLKENQFTSSSWLNALRIQLVHRGTAKNVSGIQVPAGTATAQPGDDWVYRVDVFNQNRPDLSWCTYDTTGDSYKFQAQNGAATTDEWTRYTTVQNTVSFKAPFLVTGLQNLITFLFGYADYLSSQGWVFNDPNDPELSKTTGQPLGWNTTIESFISQQYLGMTAGVAFNLNPFSQRVWFKTPRGVVSNLTKRIGLETESIPAILDVNGQQIPSSKMRVFRDDDITEIIFDEAPYVIHLLTSEYEHIIAFDQYAADDVLIYDPFLGQIISRMFISGERQLNFNGRLSYGGQYLSQGQMRENMEGAVEKILKLYDTDLMVPGSAETEHARALLGFQTNDYFTTRGSSDKTAFRFWQGMISNKGTNLSVDAFINSSKYKTYEIDEYWAYKTATFGDANGVVKTEIKVEPNDCSTELTNYLVVESDELPGLATYQSGATSTMYTITNWMSGNYNGAGAIPIIPTDENRWFSYEDVGTLSYFEADVIAQVSITADTIDRIYVIKDANGNEVKADCFEIVDAAGNVHYETGVFTPPTSGA
jgi:hypothetical protein